MFSKVDSQDACPQNNLICKGPKGHDCLYHPHVTREAERREGEGDANTPCQSVSTAISGVCHIVLIV